MQMHVTRSRQCLGALVLGGSILLSGGTGVALADDQTPVGSDSNVVEDVTR